MKEQNNTKDDRNPYIQRKINEIYTTNNVPLKRNMTDNNLYSK